MTRVVDGDSIDLSDRRRVRLLGIDAPEVGKCMFEEGRSRLGDLVKNKHVKLQDILHDDYGRILANVFVGKELVNKMMVEEGLAKFIYIKSPYYEEMKEAQTSAKAKGLGIYSPLCRTTQGQPDCLIKGNIRGGKDKIYHLSNCDNYDQVIVDEAFGDRWFCSEEEAQMEGFRKATGCQ